MFVRGTNELVTPRIFAGLVQALGERLEVWQSVVAQRLRDASGDVTATAGDSAKTNDILSA